MKKIKKLMTLTSAGLLLSTFSPSTMNVFAADGSDSDVSTESVEESNSDVIESIVDYDFVIETDVINAEEEVIGTATFRQDQSGLVKLELQLEGLEAGEFGMHIHEVGLATAPTFEDAGSHFNPEDVEHGSESETGPHAGDLPNLVVGEDGIVDQIIEIPGVSLDPDGENTLNSTDGTTLIIHTEADDYETQPTGDAGDRQAAAVIFAPLEDSEFFEADNDASDAEDSNDEESSETSETTEETADEASE